MAMLGSRVGGKEYLEATCAATRSIDVGEMQAMADAIFARYLAGRFVFIVGNGGSGANASHLCEDLAKSTVLDFDRQKRLKAMSLTDNTPAILAWANDTSYERIFVEQLKTFAEAGDLLIAISGSGNSPNVLRAVEWAKTHGVETFGVTGFTGGTLRRIADRCLHVPIDDMGIVESVHLIAFHYVLDDVHGRINFGKGLVKSA